MEERSFEMYINVLKEATSKYSDIYLENQINLFGYWAMHEKRAFVGFCILLDEKLRRNEIY